MRATLALLLLLAPLLYGSEVTVRVLFVHDGDTIVVSRDGRSETIRLKGIDCSEIDLRAKEYATEKLKGKTVVLKTHGKDKLNRTIADLFLKNGNHFNKEMVRAGNCRWGRSRAMRTKN
jgi:endonuclease YncB( thermonuclease family)